MTRLSILVSGMIGAVPRRGGATWAVLQYLIGLQRLGHDVWFAEYLSEEEVRPRRARLSSSDNATWCSSILDAAGFRERWALRVEGGESVGISQSGLARVLNGADVLLDLSGRFHDAELAMSVPIRVYVDLDPGFTQLWEAIEGIDVGLEGHTHFVTVGQGLGTDECHVPTCSVEWIPSVPPVVLSEWPPAEHTRDDTYTTVASWRGYGFIDHRGIRYGQRAHSLRSFLELPALTGQRFQLALDIDPGEISDLERLRAGGWEIVDPQRVAATPDDYQRFVQGSKAELCVAKSGYRESRCGWFSDRSACYLASGRPVVAQETGFSSRIPTGEGLFAFSSVEEAAVAIERINADYQMHRGAARRLAEETFDSDRVLTQLLDRVGVSS